MSDIRFNRWLHQSGTGGVYQASSGNVGIGTSVPSTTLDVNGSISATSITATTGTITGNLSVAGTLTYEDVTNIDAVGIITARSDLSIADKIIHTGDTNTKIRFPAADTFTVETGGSEALRVDSSQNTTFGTTSESSTSVNITASTSGNCLLSFNDTNSGQGGIRYFHSTDHMQFHTADTERLRITSSGKLEVYKGTAATGKTSGSEAFTVGNGANNKRFSVYPDGSTVIGGQGTIGNYNILLQNDGTIITASGMQAASVNLQSSSTASWFQTGANYGGADYVWAAKNTQTNTWHSGLKTTSDLYLGGDITGTRNISLNGSNGSATFTGKVDIGSSYAGGEIFKLGKSSGTSYTGYYNGGTAHGFIGYADQLVSGGASDDFAIRATNDLVFATNGNTERLRITSSGVKRVLNGNLNIYQTYIDFSGDQSSTPNTAVALYRPADGTFAISTQNTERLRITSNGKFGFNTTSPAGQVHIKGNTDESANPSIILDDNGDTRRCYVTNTSGDLMLGGIDSGTVQSRLTIHENGNMYHQRLDSAGNMMYQFATYSSQTGGAASGNTYTEHMAFRGGSAGMRTGSFSMTIYGDGGDNYMPVLFIKHGYHPTNSSYGGQWFGEMWLNNSGSINPQNYNHTGYNNWATCSFKYRWDCAHWNAKPTLNMIEHYVNYGRTNIADLEISGTQSYFLIWLLPGIYRVTYSAWDGLNAWWTNNSNVGGALTHREGGGNTTRAVRAYSGRDTRYDSNISWGSQGQT